MARKSERVSTASSKSKNVIIFHPDLGIGGAERLIVDAAVGLQELGHKVTIFTSHCDPQHCFDEARDGTLDVRVRGNTIFPSTLLNRFHILFAILRQIHLIFTISIFSDELHNLRPDVFIVDQLSACVPLLRLLYYKRQRILFYCHFPDQLLADRGIGGILGVLKYIYRIPFDWYEGWSMGASDKIVVNSNFTKSIASKVFPSLSSMFGVIYPCVDVSTTDQSKQNQLNGPLWNDKFKILLSINRFERKKDIGLALRAYHALSDEERKGTRLVLAGGYDPRVAENVQYHQELVKLSEKFGLSSATAKTIPTALGVPDTIEVLFILSVPSSFKISLLRHSKLLLYTPTNEHFGIVPVEAMQYGLPVLAANTGGPLETIVEGTTGWLRDVNDVEQWTDVIRKVLNKLDVPRIQEIGREGQKRVRERFSRDIMAKQFENEIEDMLKKKRGPLIGTTNLFLGFGIVMALIAAVVTALVRSQSFKADSSITEFARAQKVATGSKSNSERFSRKIM